MLKTLTEPIVVSESGMDRGSFDNPSALLCGCVRLNWILSSYASRSSAQRCSRAAAKEGISFFDPKIAVNGLLYVTRYIFSHINTGGSS